MKKLLQITFIVVVSLSFLGIRSIDNSNLKDSDSSSLTASYYRSYYSGDLKIYTLSKAGEEYGQSFWLNRSGKKVKTKYFASGNAYRKYQNWKGTKDILLVCSGAYSNVNGPGSEPVGLTVDNGVIVQRRYNPSMDGLVIVEAVGGIRVTDIEKEYLNVYYSDSKKRSLDVENPQHHPTLLSWAVDYHATIFQTHLLAHKNKLRLSVSSANSENSDNRRRVLALAFDSSKKLKYIVFNIQKSVDFGDISYDILDHLSEKNMNVIAMLNLDTGYFDIEMVFNDLGTRLSKFDGRRNSRIEEVSNLLVFYRD